MNKYRVLDFLNHNGKQYQMGDEVEMTEREAELLLTLGVIQVMATERQKAK